MVTIRSLLLGLTWVVAACGPQVDTDLGDSDPDACDPMRDVCTVTLRASHGGYSDALELSTARVHAREPGAESDSSDVDISASLGRYLVLLDEDEAGNICVVGSDFDDLTQIPGDSISRCVCSSCAGWGGVVYMGLASVPYEQPGAAEGTGLLVRDVDDGQLFRMRMIYDDVVDGEGEIVVEYTAVVRAPPIDDE